MLSWGPGGSPGIHRRGVHLRAGRRDSLSGDSWASLRGVGTWLRQQWARVRSGFWNIPWAPGLCFQVLRFGALQDWPRCLCAQVLVSVLPSPARPQEKHLCPAQDSAGATAHLRRAWADERGGRGQRPLFPLGWCGISFSVKAPCSRHPSGQALTLAAGFFCVQLRSRMGQLPWRCSP